MNESNSEYTKEVTNQSVGLRWMIQWCCLLSDVFLFSASLTCLFRWLSYGQPWNMGGFILSLSLAGIVYYLSYSGHKLASLNQRASIGLFAVSGWAILLPILMHALGYKW